MKTAAIVAFLKRLILSEFFKSLFWALAYKGVEKAVAKTIREFEEKGWLGDIPENEAAEILVDFVRGKPVPEQKRWDFQKMVLCAVYREKYEMRNGVIVPPRK